MTHFFGYGSLVNTATHDYPDTKRAEVHGWQRHWVPSGQRQLSFLSVQPAKNITIQGLIAQVAPLSWDKLDEREEGYTRAPLTAHNIQNTNPEKIQMYRADPAGLAGDITGKHILLSYLDCVVQGFLKEFGEQGVTNFFDTTTGWHVKIRNDRQNPIYPRAQPLSASETALVDHHIKQYNIEIV